MNIIEQLKKQNPTLYQINKFITDAKRLGYGEIELVIKTHDYISKMVEMKAVKPTQESLPKSITKRIMVGKNEKEVVQTKA